MFDLIIYGTTGALGLCCTVGYIHKNRIKENVYIDELTKMHNRKIMPKIKQREKSGKRYCVISADIDHFKNVNDTYGHAVGDAVLQTVAGTLLDSFKTDKDFVVRFGGEEFICFIEKSENCLDVIEKRVNEVREKIEALEILTSDMQLVKITTSFGVSSEDELSLDARIEKSDKNLYKAKTTGRNKVILS